MQTKTFLSLAGVRKLALGLLAAVIVTTRVMGAEAPAAGDLADGQALWTALHGHLSVGLRSTVFWLEDSERDPTATSAAQGSFYGSITELKAKQDYLPYKLFVDYLFCPYGGLELTWDRVEADTITRLDGHNDGTVTANMPMLAVYGRYPNDIGIVPYAGAGIGYAFTQFEADYHWTHAIRPDGEYHNGPYWHQTFAMNDSWGWFVYAGVAFALSQHWDLDMFIRHEGLDLKGTHNTYVGDYQTSDPADFSLPFNNDALGVGVRYLF